ncbi:MAG: SRPBCC family protein [Acidimicrobiales bacterium]|nr:SRPBCC family protein [Acidimicrobiales bacterium]
MSTRASVRRHVIIERPAHEVWSVVGRPELLHLWFPGIDECTVDGDQRDITLATGVSMTERILTNDPVQRRFQYALSGPLFHEHLATIDVIELDTTSSLVVYATDAAPATMALVLAGGAGAALDELRRQFESSVGPAVDAVRSSPTRRSS